MSYYLLLVLHSGNNDYGFCWPRQNQLFQFFCDVMLYALCIMQCNYAELCIDDWLVDIVDGTSFPFMRFHNTICLDQITHHSIIFFSKFLLNLNFFKFLIFCKFPKLFVDFSSSISGFLALRMIRHCIDTRT